MALLGKKIIKYASYALSFAVISVAPSLFGGSKYTYTPPSLSPNVAHADSPHTGGDDSCCGNGSSNSGATGGSSAGSTGNSSGT